VLAVDEHGSEHVEMMAIVDRLEFRLLGPVQVFDRDGAIDVGGAKPRLVLVQLLLNPNRVVSTDTLVDALWGEDPPPTARRSLQSHVAKLRAALGGDDGPVRSQAPGYVLAIDEDQIDLWRSDDLVRQARAALASDPRRAQHLAQQARKQWTGEPLGDLATHDQLVAQRRRLDQLWLDLIELEVDADLGAGDTAHAVEQLESLVLDRPDHEPFWARLMTAYYRLGRQSDALDTFQRARAALLDAFGLDPSPELQRLELAILEQTADLDDTQTQPCPYKGLASYQIDDADMFYGRDDVVAELLEAVRLAPFVVVVGSSGAGKSSALRAGLVKELEIRKLSGLRQASVITPGTSPMRSIYQVPGSVDVVIVDQFEELFTLTDDEATQRQFVRLLLDRVNDGAGRMVISLRADFYGHCTRLPELAPLLARRQVVVGPLSEQELRVVITKPAEKAGLTVAQELVDAIVAEAADHAGALPLVSHALVESWHRRSNDHLTLEAYRDAGSIAGAIARTAERVYGALLPAQRIQAEHLCLRLVESGVGSDHSRRKVPYAQLEGSSIDRRVIDLLVEARLLTADAEGMEIAHEALIGAWPRLRSWIDDDRDGLRMHRHLTAAAIAWDELEHDEGELYRGARLSATLSWVADAKPDLSDLERKFIDAAVGTSETQLRQQVRANRRLRVLVALSVVGLMVAAAGTAVAISKTKDANGRRAQAEAAQLAEKISGEPDLSESAVLQLAVAANRLASTPATNGLLLDAIAQASGLTSLVDLGVLPTGNSPISANGGVLVGNDDNAHGVVIDATTLKPLAYDLQPAPTVVVDTGSRLLGVDGLTLQTRDLETRQIVGPPPGVTAGAGRFALSLDGSTLAVGYEADEGRDQGGVTLFDVASGRQSLTMDSPGIRSIRGVIFSPDGRSVLGVVGDTQATSWNTATGETAFRSVLGPTDAAVTRLAMSPSGKVIAIGREDGKLEMWTSDDGRRWSSTGIQSPHRDSISWIDFDSQGQRMVSTSRDGVAVVWEATTGKVAAGPQDFEGRGGSTTFFRPGSTTDLVNVAGDGRTWKWEPQHEGLLTTVPGVDLSATVSASPETRVLVSSTGGAAVYDIPDAAPRQVRLDTIRTVRGIATSGNGKRFVVVFLNGDIELHDMTSAAVVRSFDQRAETFGVDMGDIYGQGTLVRREIMMAVDRSGTRVAFQADDHRIYVIADDGSTVRTINLSTQRLRLQALNLNDDGSELVVSTEAGEAIWYDIDEGDSTTLARSGNGFDAQFVSGDRVAVVGKGVARVIDPRSAQTTKSLALGTDLIRLAVDDSGRLLATADRTGSIQLWDARLAVRVGEPLRIRTVSSPVPMRFSPDGQYLVVSGADDTTWVKVSIADWPQMACNLVTDPISPEVRAHYLGSPDAPAPCP
jgi:DNA-binding SARP family transcriptional activator/WD40 repeat protein